MPEVADVNLSSVGRAALARIMQAPDRELEAEQYLHTLIQEMGGAEAVARRHAELMKDESTSKETQRKLFDNLAAMIRYVESRRGKAPDLKDATDQELMAIIREAMGGTDQGQQPQHTP
jgi:hypothetical protein